jgi:hypothetical protein
MPNSFRVGACNGAHVERRAELGLYSYAATLCRNDSFVTTFNVYRAGTLNDL